MSKKYRVIKEWPGVKVGDVFFSVEIGISTQLCGDFSWPRFRTTMIDEKDLVSGGWIEEEGEE